MTLIRFCLFYIVAVIQGDPQTVWGTVILAWNKTERRGDTEWQSERTNRCQEGIVGLPVLKDLC